MQLLCNSRACLLPPIPAETEKEIQSELTYRYRKALRGKEAWEKFGRSSGNEFIWKSFVRKEPDGRISVPAGLSERVLGIMQKHNLNPSVQYVDIPGLNMAWNDLKARISFRTTQEETLRALLSKPFGGIEASPGYGKGFLIKCICHLNPEAKIDITCDSVVVCRQLQDYLDPFISGIGFIGDGSKTKGDRITIYVLDSLHKSDGDADILIVDEVHTAVSDKASMKFSTYRRARRYWFSATPEGRADNTDLRVEALFGPTRKVITYQECVALGLVVNLGVKWGHLRLGYNPIDGVSDATQKARMGIWRNDARNRFITSDIMSIPEDQQTLVLCSKVEHLCHLAQYLPNFEIAFGANKQSLEEAKYWGNHGKIPESSILDRKRKNSQMRQDFTKGLLRKVLVTSIWDTGANFPELSDIYRTDPFDGGFIKDVQAPGRGSRLFDGKDCACLHDFVDHDDPGLYDKARRRRTNYLSQGWDEQDWDDQQ